MTRALKNAIAVSALPVLVFGVIVTASAQTCTWGGTPAVTPPSATPLRAYRDVLHAPARVAIGPAGELYATDPRKGRIVVRDRYGRLRDVVEGFDTPLGIAVDGAGRIYVGEHGSGSVAVFDARWSFIAELGAGDREFLMPSDIAVDTDTGWAYVSDSGANQIRVYSPAGPLLRLFGGRGTAPGQLRFPAGIYVGAGEVFVADQDNDRVQVFDQYGTFLRCFGGSGGMSFGRKFGSIQGLTGDAAGRIYVADAFQGWVRVFDRRGALLGTIGSFGDGPSQLRTPMDVAIDPYNRLFVSSANNARIEVFGLDQFSDPRVIPALVNVKPDTLERSSERRFVTAYVEVPGYGVEDIDPTSITANAVPALPRPVEIGDYDADGVPDLMVKFDAESVVAELADGDAVVVVAGRLRDGAFFEGSDTVRVHSHRGRPAPPGRGRR